MPIMQTVKTAIKSKDAVFIIFIIAAAVYLPILSGDFVYDDVLQIDTSDYIHQPANFPEVLSFSVTRKDVLDNNRPVMLLSLMLDSILWGHNPFGYHFTNLLLHSFNSSMVFLLIYFMLSRMILQDGNNGTLWAAFFGGLIFAIHPANSEAVCVITFREDLLVTFFTLAAFIMAERFPAEHKLTNILLTGMIIISFFAAAAAKESGTVAPFYLLIYWLIIRRGSQKRAWVKLIASGFIVTAAFMIARFTIVPEQSSAGPYLGGFFSRILTLQPRIWVFELLELIWPKLLCAEQTIYSIRNITLPIAIIVLILVIAAILPVCRKNAVFCVGVLFYFIGILPTSNLMRMFKPMADRYLYLPMVGFCIALSAIICTSKLPKRKWAAIAGVGIFVFFGAFTVQRELVWQNNRSVWENTVQKNPFSFFGYDYLGFAYFDVGEFEKALPCFQIAIRLVPDGADAHAGLAITYEALGMTAAADNALNKAVSIDNKYADADILLQKLLWTPKQAEKLRLIANRIRDKKQN